MLSGKDIAAVDSPIGRLGLTVCYDLRFPEIYQQLRFQHEAQVELDFLTFKYGCFFNVMKLAPWIMFLGHIGSCSFHHSYWSGTLGDSSSCPCN